MISVWQLNDFYGFEHIVLTAFTATEDHLILVSQALHFSCTVIYLIPEWQPQEAFGCSGAFAG